MSNVLEEWKSDLTAAQAGHCASLLAVVNSSVIYPQGEIKFKRMWKRKILLTKTTSNIPLKNHSQHPPCLSFVKIRGFSMCVFGEL